MEVHILRAGDGLSFPTKGNKVRIHYEIFFTNGKKFSSSRDAGEMLTFIIGTGEVIGGLEEAVKQMSVGEKARVDIPYDHAYGVQGLPGLIPPMTDLIIDIELFSFI